MTGLGSAVGSERQPGTNRPAQAVLLGALSPICLVARRQDNLDPFICSLSGAW